MLDYQILDKTMAPSSAALEPLGVAKVLRRFFEEHDLEFKKITTGKIFSFFVD